MNIVILTESASFPEGMAGSSRVRLYAKGLIENNCSASVMVVRGTENRNMIRNNIINGTFQKIPFKYTSNNTVIPKYWILRRFDEIRGMLGAYYHLKRLKAQGCIDCALIYSNDTKFIKPFSFMCHRIGIPVLLDLCEWPLAKATAYGLNIKRARRFMQDAMVCVDGVIPISTYLQERIEEYEFDNNVTIPHIKIPILVDTDLFIPAQKEKNDRIATFLWSGSLDYTRIVQCIADACRILSYKRSDFSIDILGGLGPENQKKKLEAYIQKCQIGDFIKIWDFLSDEDLLVRYQNASALLVLIVDDDISRSRFPTKLGEYLAVGKPIIATSMGELKRYLKDGETAFLVSDTSPENLAQQMARVLDDPKKAEAIGLAGRTLAEEAFCYLKHGERLRDFINEVILNYKNKVSIKGSERYRFAKN